MFKNSYRIVETPDIRLYRVQVRYWFCPLWQTIHYVSSQSRLIAFNRCLEVIGDHKSMKKSVQKSHHIIHKE